MTSRDHKTLSVGKGISTTTFTVSEPLEVDQQCGISSVSLAVAQMQLITAPPMTDDIQSVKAKARRARTSLTQPGAIAVQGDDQRDKKGKRDSTARYGAWPEAPLPLASTGASAGAPRKATSALSGGAENIQALKTGPDNRVNCFPTWSHFGAIEQS